MGARSSGTQYIKLSLIQELPCLLSQKKRKKKERLRVLKSGRFHETMPFATTWMDLEMVILSKVSQKEKNMV